MKIAYLSCDFGVRVFGTSGNSVHLRELARALRGLGHEVKIFSPSPGTEDGGARDPDFHLLPISGFTKQVAGLLRHEDTDQPSHLFRELKRVLHAEQVQRTLLPVLRDFRPDFIYERYALFAYAGVELARELRIPLLLEVNAPLSQEAAKYRELVLRHTASELERSILNAADALVVVSQTLQDFAQDLGVPGDKISIVPTAVDVDKFSPDISGQSVRDRYGLNGKNVIGFLGSLKPWHDLDTFLAAARLLVRDDESIHVLIVGAGPRLEEVRSQGASYITCTGAVEHDEVPAHLAAMDVVVTPYALKGDAYFSPLKLYESMSMARPAVGARFAQIANVLTHGENGMMYEPSNEQDLADKIQQILALPDKGAAIGAAARETMKGQTWEQNAREVTAIAESLIETSDVSE